MREVRELPPGATRLAFPAMRELRTHLADAEAFVRAIDDLQRSEGYRLVGTFEDGDPDAVAVAGFRTGTSLSWGRFLYVDDLVTRSAFRSRGHARALMAWLGDEARRSGCDSLHLDSGAERHEAHRFYLGQELRITGFHFARVLG